VKKVELITILYESKNIGDITLLSEQALANDWNKPEEDAAWGQFYERY